jgi:hypothetical protein
VSLRPTFGFASPFGRRPKLYAGVRLALDCHRKHAGHAGALVLGCAGGAMVAGAVMPQLCGITRASSGRALLCLKERSAVV